jgi:hypothetical protein
MSSGMYEQPGGAVTGVAVVGTQAAVYPWQQSFEAMHASSQ